jgi:hypothetical protein
MISGVVIDTEGPDISRIVNRHSERGVGIGPKLTHYLAGRIERRGEPRAFLAGVEIGALARSGKMVTLGEADFQGKPCPHPPSRLGTLWI